MNKEYGKIFAMHRVALGLKSRDASLRCGVSTRTMYNWENVGMTKKRMFSALEQLGCSIKHYVSVDGNFHEV